MEPRIRGALVDPSCEIGEDLTGQLRPVLRHPGFRVRVVELLDETAGRGIAGHDRRTGLSALPEGLAMIQAQPPFLLLRAMTLIAFLNERRPDLLLEEVELSGRRAADLARDEE